MFLGLEKIKTTYSRASKHKIQHTYSKTKTIGIFICDSCGQEFKRDCGQIDRKRLNNNFAHVCSNCNQKQFAQKKSAESRKFWNMPVDQDVDISKI